MINLIHPVAGVVAMITIATFWLSTTFSELFGSQELITTVKMTIPWGLLILVPSLAATGATGFKLSHGRRSGLVGTKFKRMPFIAVNGIIVLIPCVFFLAYKASLNEFDTSFYAVQGIELLAGATNFVLLGLNMRDGLKMKGRFRRHLG